MVVPFLPARPVRPGAVQEGLAVARQVVVHHLQEGCSAACQACTPADAPGTASSWAAPPLTQPPRGITEHSRRVGAR